MLGGVAVFMRILGRILWRGVQLLLLLLLIAAGLVWWTLPPASGAYRLAGLAAPVEVRLDTEGVPRIRAESEHDAWMAVGFLHARERMLQMELMRRGASGRLAELAGPGVLRIDRFMRLLGLAQRAEADLATLPAGAREMLEAYAAGVNAWIAERGRFADPMSLVIGTPAPWRPVDSLLWGKVMGLWLSGNWRMELDRARLAAILPPERLAEIWPEDRSPGRPDAPELPAAAGAAQRLGEAVPLPEGHLARLAAALPRFPGEAPLPASASNAWAVAGWRSASGAPMLATDPHLGFSAPILWYLVRIELPDRVLLGATAPGVPGIVIGRNGDIAWGFTTTHSDTQDVFVERLAGADAYETPEGPRPFTLREERIGVRGGETVVMRVRETRHGPVLSDLDAPAGRPDGTVLALAMANLAPGDSAAAGLWALNGARSLAEARAAAAMITSPPQNLMVATRTGEIALYLTGRTPVRRSGDGTRPMPGWDGQADWTGFLPFDALPHVENPPSGLLVNANNRVVPAGGPFLGHDWFGDWRFRRIGALLAARERHQPADFAAIQADSVSLLAQELLPALRAMPRPDGAAGAAFDLLAAWDGGMAGMRAQPVIFHATLMRFGRAVLARAGVPEGVWEASPEFLRFVLAADRRGAHWCGGDCGPMLAEALRAAVAELAQRYGADPAAWRWGVAHPAVFDHALFRFIPGLGRLVRLSAPAAGDGETVNRAGFRVNGAGLFEAVHGPGFRGVFDLADAEASFAVIATGQSGHPLSRHWGDLLARWREGGLLRLGADAGAGATTLRLAP